MKIYKPTNNETTEGLIKDSTQRELFELEENNSTDPQVAERMKKFAENWRENFEENNLISTIYKEEQLPLWPEQTRAQANSLIRSSLFSATNPSAKREQYEKKVIASVEGIEILYTGQQLTQIDADVFDAVLHVCRESPLGAECRVTGYHLLQMLGKTDSKQNYEVLDKQLTRMKATAMRIRLNKKWSYEGSLIHEIRRDEENKNYLISLNQKFSKLFQKDQYTLINQYLLQDLKGNPLAQWVVRYFSSHADPFPMKFKTIRDLSGSNIKEISSFRQKFKKAIEKIELIHSNLFKKYEEYREYSGAGEWSMTLDKKRDLVSVVHPISKSQKKYLSQNK